MKYQMLQGRRVKYVPGWDCHGLPIELKARMHDSHVRYCARTELDRIMMGVLKVCRARGHAELLHERHC